MIPAIKEQIRFVLEDNNEVMTTALKSDLDDENKQMNRKLIKRHECILAKLDSDECLSQVELQLVRDANEIHLNDTLNLNGHYKQAVALGHWLDTVILPTKEHAMKILEHWLDSTPNTPARVYTALHALWEEATPNDDIPVFDEHGKCLKCGSRVAFADVTDTLLFVGYEIIKRYDGDITNRNCVRCNHPKLYEEFKHWDKNGGSSSRANRH